MTNLVLAVAKISNRSDKASIASSMNNVARSSPCSTVSIAFSGFYISMESCNGIRFLAAKSFAEPLMRLYRIVAMTFSMVEGRGGKRLNSGPLFVSHFDPPQRRYSMTCSSTFHVRTHRRLHSSQRAMAKQQSLKNFAKQCFIVAFVTAKTSVIFS